MKKIFAGFVIEDPNGYDQQKTLIAVSYDRDKLLTKLKIEFQIQVEENEYETCDFEIIEVQVI